MLGLCAQTCTRNCSSCPTSKKSYDILVCQWMLCWASLCIVRPRTREKRNYPDITILVIHGVGREVGGAVGHGVSHGVGHGVSDMVVSIVKSHSLCKNCKATTKGTTLTKVDEKWVERGMLDCKKISTSYEIIQWVNPLNWGTDNEWFVSDPMGAHGRHWRQGGSYLRPRQLPLWWCHGGRPPTLWRPPPWPQHPSPCSSPSSPLLPSR